MQVRTPILFTLCLTMIATTAVCAGGNLQMTTYYPSPNMTASEMTLVPRPEILSGGINPQSCTQIGRMYFADNIGLKLCQDMDGDGNPATGVEWGSLGVWTQNKATDSIYPIDYVNPNLKVGIGTMTPHTPLEVAEPTGGRVNLYRDADPILLGDTLGSVVFGGRGSADIFQSAVIGAVAAQNWSGGAAGSSLSFLTTVNGINSLTEKVRITHDGKVGIGTSNPLNLLHITDVPFPTTANLDDSSLILENSFAQYISIVSPDNVGGPPVAGIQFLDNNSVNGGIFFDGAGVNDGLLFRSGGNTTRMVIDSSGNVGIGTTTPQAALDIYGSMAIDSNGNVGIGTTSPQAPLHIIKNVAGPLGLKEAQIILDNPDCVGALNVCRPWSIYIDSSGGAFRKGDLVFDRDGLGNFRIDKSGRLKLKMILGLSSRKEKKQISSLSSEEYADILAKVRQTDLVRYRFKSEPDDSKLHLGVIAEDAPDVIVDEQKQHLRLIDYSGFLLAAIKAQQGIIDGLQAELSEIKTQQAVMPDLQKQLDDLKAQVESLKNVSSGSQDP